MQHLNLSHILKPYQNKWVALSLDYRRVLSSGKTLREAIRNLKKDEEKEAIFHRVIPAGYVPTRV